MSLEDALCLSEMTDKALNQPTPEQQVQCANTGSSLWAQLFSPLLTLCSKVSDMTSVKWDPQRTVLGPPLTCLPTQSSQELQAGED